MILGIPRLSKQIAHSTADLHLKEISYFLSVETVLPMAFLKNVKGPNIKNLYFKFMVPVAIGEC